MVNMAPHTCCPQHWRSHELRYRDHCPNLNHCWESLELRLHSLRLPLKSRPRVSVQASLLVLVLQALLGLTILALPVFATIGCDEVWDLSTIRMKASLYQTLYAPWARSFLHQRMSNKGQSDNDNRTFRLHPYIGRDLFIKRLRSAQW